jgi:hypothetical protein
MAIIPAVEGVLGEDRVHGLVELLRATQVGAKRLLHRHPRTVGPTGRRDAPGDPAEEGWRHLEVEQGLAARGHLLGHRLVGPVVVEVAVDVAEQPEHPGGRRRSTSPTNAGKVSSLARSPVAPKITNASTRSLIISVVPVRHPESRTGAEVDRPTDGV